MLTSTIVIAAVAFLVGTITGYITRVATSGPPAGDPDLIITVHKIPSSRGPADLDEYLRSRARHPSARRFTRETDKE